MIADVILLTYGEPPYPSLMDQWRYSNRILFKLTRRVAPIPSFAVPFFGLYRGYTRASTWKKEHYSSPLEHLSERQMDGIRRELALAAPEIQWRVHLAFEFRDPGLHQILSQVEKSRTDALVLVPMYLAISDFTTRISQLDFTSYQAAHGSHLPVPRTVTFRSRLEDLSRITAGHVREQLTAQGIPPEQRKTMGLLLGCHGTLVEPPKGIEDTGYRDTFETYRHLQREFQDEFRAVDIGWLNHRLGGEWTTPTLEHSAKAMKEQGIERLVYYPFGFLADNAETQLEGRVVLRDLGIENYTHIPCANDHAGFLQFLSSCIVEAANRVESESTDAKTEAA